jgi:hypothetical protein
MGAGPGRPGPTEPAGARDGGLFKLEMGSFGNLPFFAAAGSLPGGSEGLPITPALVEVGDRTPR